MLEITEDAVCAMVAFGLTVLLVLSCLIGYGVSAGGKFLLRGFWARIHGPLILPLIVEGTTVSLEGGISMDRAA